MARPLTRDQRLQNRAFLKALRRSGNVRLAAREAGAKYGTMQHRRKQHPTFAASWDAAITLAQARLSSGKFGPRFRGDDEGGHRTLGGEPHLVRLKDGRVQMRVAQPGKLTREAEQAFLAALSATANVTLSAAAVGASPRAFYRRKKQCPAFAREMRLALQMGYPLRLSRCKLIVSSSFYLGPSTPPTCPTNRPNSCPLASSFTWQRKRAADAAL